MVADSLACPCPDMAAYREQLAEREREKAAKEQRYMGAAKTSICPDCGAALVDLKGKPYLFTADLWRMCQCEAAAARKQAQWDAERAEADTLASQRAAEAKAAKERRDAERLASAPVYKIRVSAEQRREQRQGAIDDRWLAVKEQEIADREARVWAPRTDGDGAPVGLTLADFEQEVSLLDVERLPSAFERTDGATLLYEGRFNTLYGEAAVGKTWTAQMVVIGQLRAGRRVIWWDSEDRASTLAKRLQLLRATDLIGHPNLKWITGDVQANPSALAFLDGGDGPGLMVIDSATSFGCPSDGADVAAWLNAFINPWWNAGHTVLLLDHVPKQRKDRPRGGIGSQAKLARIDGAALYAHGTPWNGQQGGHIHLTVHKDRQGQLPATLNGTAATITAEWDGPTLDWRVDLPNAKDEGEDLQIELMDALEGAGAEGVKGSRALRELLKGKRAKDIDAAREELL